MNKIVYLPLIMGAIAATSCAGEGKSPKQSGIDLANLDTMVMPGVDFYDYATGGWQKANPLKPEYARFGSFDQLRENNREQLRVLVEELSTQPHEAGTVAQKISDFYNGGLDSTRLNGEGGTPVQIFVAEAEAINDKKALSNFMGRLMRSGINPFFHLFVYADFKNSDMNILHTYQGGIGMSQRDYYLEDSESMKKIREEYANYIKSLFVLSGKSDAEAQKAAKDIIALETRLAQASFTQEQLRDPLSNYNKMSVEEFVAGNKAFEWDELLEAANLKGATQINAAQIPFLDAMSKILNDTPMEVIREYLTFNILNEASPYLSDDFYNANFNFYGKTLSGKQEQQARWKRALSTTDNALGEAVGEMYVEKYFPVEAKERMLTMVGNLQTALGQRIEGLEWMSDTTKQQALDKLNSFQVKIGYPDKWRDYSSLDINSDNSYLQNVLNSNQFEWDYMVAQNEKPVDKEKWQMTPQTVNAYYDPSTNEICFPAGILQPPFFYLNADDAVNYGAIGVVIGHEMTHGFDDQGRQFDKNGNLSDWWTEEDAAKFAAKTDVLVQQFDDIVVTGDTRANGRFTLGENIADQGGLLVSHQALKNVYAQNPADEIEIDGFTPDQRFLLAYAGLWAGNIRDEEILRLTKIDPHSLGRWRVNGTLPNLDFYYSAFEVQPTDSMYRAPEERIVVW